MKSKLLKFYKEYKLAIIIALTIIVVGTAGIILFLRLNDNSSIKEFKNDNYIVKYDSNWEINSEKDKTIILKHQNGSKLSIEILDLHEEQRFLSVEDLMDEILHDIENQNENFKLIYKESDFITKNQYQGYRMLYENEETQAMVVVAKKSDQLIIFTFEAKNNYFDILLDSVQNIIYEFDTLEKRFDLIHKLDIETTKINYDKSKSVVSLLDEVEQYEIASNNYYVKYLIPNNFKKTNINSTMTSFKFEGLEEGKITLNVNLYNKNIYEHLSKEKTLNIYSKNKYYKENEDYSNFTESIDKFESDYESYIYKCSYYYDKTINYNENYEISYTSELKENIILVYALDRNHILVIDVLSSKVAIPEELINMIKIESSENYSSFINLKKENGMIIGNLKRFVGYEGKTEEIIIRLPEKFQEVDYEANIYETRYYSLNYNEKLEIYDYDIKYLLSPDYSKIDGQIEIINNSFSKIYGDYKELSYTGEKIINDKKFIIYDGGYTNISGTIFTTQNRIKYYTNVKVLFYELANGGYLKIKIEGNDKEITDEMLNEITNLEIKTN